STLRSCLRTRASMQIEILTLRHQLAVLQRRTNNRAGLRTADRLLWVMLSRVWAQGRSALVIVKPETVIAGQRKGFRLYWRWKSRAGNSGRPCVSREIRELIRQMSTANPLWGPPRMHGELLKLGIQISQATVAKYMVRQRKPPSQIWRTFLENHIEQLVSTDFLVVTTVSFRLLFVLVVLAHQRRQAIHFNVTAHPTAAWRGQQIAEAFPWDRAPRYLLHDRDRIYGAAFRERVAEMGICEVLTAPRCPWQNAYAERFSGSLRRECLDHIIVFNESSLRRILKAYFEYYEHSRTHLALGKDASIQSHTTVHFEDSTCRVNKAVLRFSLEFQ
ncbi:MAG: integrase core domain-containing protein, partial [Pyrinomonadaceae bacterium]